MTTWLAMVTADGSERSFPLRSDRIVVGSDILCDLRVAVPTVSKHHCEIVVDGDRLRLKDLGSESGTFHNGTQVEQADLAPNDRLTIGPVTFVVRVDQDSDATPCVSEPKPQLGQLRAADRGRVIEGG